MVTGYDIFTVTSGGTGVAEVELGSGINTPSQARQIVSIIPYAGCTGAFTVAQDTLAEIAIRSDSISLTPKRVVVSGGNGGVGTFTDVICPILDEWKFYTPLQAQSTLHAFVTPQMSSTVASDYGCAVQYETNDPQNQEKFWLKPSDETSTGTAVAKVTGNTIQVTTGTSGGTITDLWATTMITGTVTVSESIYGSMQFQSNDYNDAMSLIVPVQPRASGLATATVPAIKLARYTVNKPTKANTLITTSFSNDEALTVAQSFIGGVGYIKS